MSILPKIFAKYGVKEVSELEPEEREIYENYQKVLSKEDLTLQDVKLFLENQIRIIEMKWRDFNGAGKPDLIPYHVIYCVLRDMIAAPQAERERLEQYLIQLHKL